MSKQKMTTIDPAKLRAFVEEKGAEATKLEIMQAISYAAHLIYKFAEQDEIG